MDNRKHPRIRKEFSVRMGVVSYPPDREPRKRCRSKDMGEGGICVVTPSPIDPRGPIFISGWQLHKKTFSYFVDLSSENPLTVIGHVVWNRVPTDPTTRSASNSWTSATMTAWLWPTT